MIDIEGDCTVNTSCSEADNAIQMKYLSLRRKCEQIQQNNEKLVNRIQHVKRLTKRYKRERRFLTSRLDKYGDDYKDQLVPTLWEEHAAPTVASTQPVAVSSQSMLQIKSETTDRHTSAFKNFCHQHQLQIHTQHTQDTGEELSSAELNSKLKMKWNKMTLQQRQLYMDIGKLENTLESKTSTKLLAAKAGKGLHSGRQTT